MDSIKVKIESGSKEYEKKNNITQVFQNIDLEIKDQEILVILGPSGCGKSTLLRIIARLENLSSGFIIDNDGENANRTGMVFQEPLLYPWLTAKQNVELGLSFSRNSVAKTENKTSNLLKEFGIEQLSNSFPNEISGGQAQRVNLARTLIINPKILLLDEPFGALDPNTRTHLQVWLLEVKEDRDLTIVLVTHDVEEAIRLADRIIIMSANPGTLIKTWDISKMRQSQDFTPQIIKKQILENYELSSSEESSY